MGSGIAADDRGQGQAQLVEQPERDELTEQRRAALRSARASARGRRELRRARRARSTDVVARRRSPRRASRPRSIALGAGGRAGEHDRASGPARRREERERSSRAAATGSPPRSAAAACDRLRRGPHLCIGQRDRSVALGPHGAGARPARRRRRPAAVGTAHGRRSLDRPADAAVDGRRPVEPGDHVGDDPATRRFGCASGQQRAHDDLLPGRRSSMIALQPLAERPELGCAARSARSPGRRTAG